MQQQRFSSGTGGIEDLERTTRNLLDESMKDVTGRTLPPAWRRRKVPISTTPGWQPITAGTTGGTRLLGREAEIEPRSWRRTVDVRHNEMNAFAPRYDLVDDGDYYHLDFSSLTNVDKDDVNVGLSEDGREVTVSGYKPVPAHLEKGEQSFGALHSEGVYGFYRRVVYLPEEVDADSCVSTLVRGNLHIKARKRNAAGTAGRAA